MEGHRCIPSTWTRGYEGVLEQYTSPSGNQWIRHGISAHWNWYSNGLIGTADTPLDCISQMSKHGYVEGEFDP